MKKIAKKDIFSKKDIGKFGKERKPVKFRIKKRPRIRDPENPGFKIDLKIVLAIIVIAIVVFAALYIFVYKKTPEQKAGIAAVKLADKELPALMGANNLKQAQEKGYAGAMYKSVVLQGNMYNVELVFTINRMDLKKNERVPVKYTVNVLVDAETFKATNPEKWV